LHASLTFPLFNTRERDDKVIPQTFGGLIHVDRSSFFFFITTRARLCSLCFGNEQNHNENIEYQHG